MDREKVFAGLTMLADRKNDDTCEGLKCCKIAEDAIDLLKEQEWIPVEERLPKSMANKVLVYLQHEDLVDQIGYGHYEKFKGKGMWYDLEHDEQFSKRGYTVTHWMSLPKSPKGERLALS